MQQVLDAHEGGATGAWLRRGGLTDRDVRALVEQGRLLRLRREAFAGGAEWEASAPWDRHLLRARTVLATLRSVGPEKGQLVLSHHSALAVHRLDIYRADDEVHASRVQEGRGHRDSGLWVHAPVPREQVCQVDGMPLVAPALACLQVAVVAGGEAGLVAADSALRAGACTREQLTALTELSCLLRGRPAVRLVAELADGLRESAGESRTAWMLHLLDIPVEAQVEIRDDHGILVARSDFRVKDSAVLLEFDGRVKYTDPEVLMAEKRREDRLRELGYEVVRLTWEDLARPQVVRAKILAALARASRRQPV